MEWSSFHARQRKPMPPSHTALAGLATVWMMIAPSMILLRLSQNNFTPSARFFDTERTQSV
jgi:hypothetical protein